MGNYNYLNRILYFGLFCVLLVGCSENEEKESNPEQISSEDTISTQIEVEQIGLTDSTISTYFQEIYNAKKLIWAEDDLMLTIIDSLYSKDSNNCCYYFEVFTMSMNGSDGFYSESVGYNAYKFLNSYLEQFANCFSNSSKLGDLEMKNWAYYVYAEIQISNENEEQKALLEFIDQIEIAKIEIGSEFEPVLSQLISNLQSFQN
jgi:hypothetical protein